MVIRSLAVSEAFFISLNREWKSHNQGRCGNSHSNYIHGGYHLSNQGKSSANIDSEQIYQITIHYQFYPSLDWPHIQIQLHHLQISIVLEPKISATTQINSSIDSNSLSTDSLENINPTSSRPIFPIPRPLRKIKILTQAEATETEATDPIVETHHQTATTSIVSNIIEDRNGGNSTLVKNAFHTFLLFSMDITALNDRAITEIFSPITDSEDKDKEKIKINKDKDEDGG
ncbi:hypothetical protein ACTA71_011183 [Dictyostelium dimigraforme]